MRLFGIQFPKRLMQLFIVVLVLSVFTTAGIIVNAYIPEKEGNIKVDKTATVSDLKNRVYDLTLSVKGTPVTDKSLDLILVLDISNSMNWPVNSPKYIHMKEAAKKVVEQTFNNKGDNRVSVVTYAGAPPWPYNKFNMLENEPDAYVITKDGSGNPFSKDKNFILNSINGIVSTGNNNPEPVPGAGKAVSNRNATNIQAGFMLARDVMQNYSRKDNNINRVVVLMTDGQPTLYYKGTNSQYPYWSWADDEYGGTFTPNGQRKAIDEAKKLKDDGVSIYTIGLVTDFANDASKLAGTRGTLDPKGEDKYNKKYFETPNGNDLPAVFIDALNEAKNADIAKNAKVTDIIPDKFELVEGSIQASEGTSATFAKNDKGETIITWNIGTINDINRELKYKIKAKPHYFGQINTNVWAELTFDKLSNKTTDSPIKFPVPNVPVRPYAMDDNYSGYKNQPIEIAAKGILQNDGVTKVEEAGAKVNEINFKELVKKPQNGKVTCNDDGSFKYVPNKDWTGVDTFTYKNSVKIKIDGKQKEYDSDEATVTVTVKDTPQLTVYFKDKETQKDIAAQESYTDKPGSTVEVNSKTIDDYELAKGQEPKLTYTFSDKDDKYIFWYVKKKPMPVIDYLKVYYKERASGNELKEPSNYQGEEKTTVKVKAENITGYKVEGDGNYTHTFGVSGKVYDEYTFWYNKIQSKLTVHFKDKETNESIAESKVYNGNYNDKLNVEALVIPGYKLVDGSINPYTHKFGEQDTEYTFWYQKKVVTLTVNYKEEGTNNVLKESDKIKGEFNSTTIVNAPVIEGYTLAKNQQSIYNHKFKDVDEEYTFYYTKNVYKLTIHYIDENEKELRPTVSIDMHFQDEYKVDIPDIAGYTKPKAERDGAPLEGKMPAGNLNIFLVYSKETAPPAVSPAEDTDTHKLILNFIDEYGNKVKDSAVFEKKTGDRYKVVIPDIKGYVKPATERDNKPLEGNMPATDYNMYFVYQTVKTPFDALPKTGGFASQFLIIIGVIAVIGGGILIYFTFRK